MLLHTRLPDPVEEPFLSVTRYAAMTTLSPRSVRRALDRGEIPHTRVGDRILIHTAAALRALGL